MTALQAPARPEAEVLPPGRGRLRVVACPHPFMAARRIFEVEAGATLAEILDLIQPDPLLLMGAHVFVGDWEVPRDRWRLVRPKPETHVTIRVVPGDGGDGNKSPLRTVLTIAVLVAAVWFPPAIGLQAGTFAAAAASAAITVAGTLAINALLPPPGPQQAALPPGGGKETPVYSISGSRNEFRPYDAVPRVLGEHRMWPVKGARDFTEIRGDNQFLRALFVWGRGPLSLRDFKIGETPVARFDDVEMRHRYGTPGDPPLSLFSDDVFEEPLSALLANASGWVTRRTQPDTESFSIDVVCPQGLVRFDDQGNKHAVSVLIEVQYAPAGTTAWSIPAAGQAFGARGSGTLAKPAQQTFIGLQTQTLETALWYRVSMVRATGALAVRAGQPSYWLAFTSSGGSETTRFREQPATLPDVPLTEVPLARVERRSDAGNVQAVDIVDERPAAAPFSSGADFAVSPSGGGVTVAAGTLADATIVLSAARASAVRKSKRFDVGKGQYDVRVRRSTADSADERTLDQTFWTALRSIRFNVQLVPPGFATTELRIRASEQLSGVIDQFNGIAASILPDWDGTDWSTERPTSNPASLARYLLQGGATRTALPDSRLHLADFEALHEIATVRGWAYNAVIARHLSVKELLTQVLAAGRASPSLRDNKIGIVIEEKRTAAVMPITPRNSRGFTATKVFVDLPHALRVPFVNRDQGWADDEVFVYRDGFDAINATRFERLDLPGITNPGQAWRLGRYYLAVAERRNETYEIEMDIAHIVAVRGDLCLVTHDVVLVGLGSGRIKSLVTDGGGNFTDMSVDEELTMQAGKSYAVAVNTPGGIVTATVATVPGTSQDLVFSPAVPAASALAVGNIVGFGEAGQVTLEALVKSLRRNDRDGATLTLVPHAPEVFDAADGPLPPFQSNLTVPPGLLRPAILNLRSDESVLARDPDGSLRVRILVDLGPPSGRSPGRRVIAIETNIRPADGAEDWSVLPLASPGAREISVDVVEQGRSYDLRFRYLFEDGQSPWTAAVTHLVVGKSSLPPGAENLLLNNRNLIWSADAVLPLDFDGWQVRANAGNNRHWPTAQPLHTGFVAGPPFDIGARGAGVRSFLVKGVDTSGNESANAAVLVLDLGDPLVANLVETIDLAALGFPGTLTDGSVVAGAALADADATQLWSGDDANPLWSGNDATLLWGGGYLAMTYDFTVLPDGATVPADFSFSQDVTGTSWSLAFRLAGSARLWSGDDTTPLWSGNDAAPLWEPVGDYTPWPGLLEGATRQAYEFRLVVAGGQLQGRVDALAGVLDVPDIEETFEDLVLGSGGTRLPIAKTYRRIKVVGGIVLQDDGNGAEVVRVLDKDPASGPLLRAFDGAGTPVAALIDATIQGY